MAEPTIPLAPIRCELRGREVWAHMDGREPFLLARIREDLTLEQWADQYGAAADRG